ncbi:MAG: hypothetical protein OXD37_03355 [Acidimicrobiaceae bacterium]|nr:hypothetical protein [Acidimicrobiaceae bacterium]
MGVLCAGSDADHGRLRQRSSERQSGPSATATADSEAIAANANSDPDPVSETTAPDPLESAAPCDGSSGMTVVATQQQPAQEAI